MSAWTAPRFACIASIEFLVSAWAAPMSACIAPIRSKSRSTAEPGRERRDEALDLFDTLEEQSRPPRGNKAKTRCVVPRAAPWSAATRKLRGTKDRGAAAWNAATCRTARHHGTRQQEELRGTMGRGNMQVRGTMERGSMRVRGTMGRGIQMRGTMDERQHTSARQHYESAAARVRGTTYARPHSCAAAYMNAAP